MTDETKTVIFQNGDDFTVIRGNWPFIKAHIEDVLNAEDPNILNRVVENKDGNYYTLMAWQVGDNPPPPETDDWFDVTDDGFVAVYDAEFISEDGNV